MYGNFADLESAPSLEQKRRLDDFLYELREISRRYDVVLESHIDGMGLAVLDARSDHVIGIDLEYILDENTTPPAVKGYDCQQSIHDGDWVVLDRAGTKLVEQRLVDGRALALLRRRHISR